MKAHHPGQARQMKALNLYTNRITLPQCLQRHPLAHFLFLGPSSSSCPLPLRLSSPSFFSLSLLPCAPSSLLSLSLLPCASSSLLSLSSLSSCPSSVCSLSLLLLSRPSSFFFMCCFRLFGFLLFFSILLLLLFPL